MSPKRTGCVETLLQTLKTPVLQIERFDTLEQLRARIRRLAHHLNEHWLLERHDYLIPPRGPPTSRRLGMIAAQVTREGPGAA